MAKNMGKQIPFHMVKTAKVHTLVSSIIGSLLAAIFIGFGINFLLIHDYTLKKTTVTVKTAKCNILGKSKYGIYKCDLTVTYPQCSKDVDLTLYNREYKVGDKISLLYDPSNPCDIKNKPSVSSKTAGGILIGIGILILIVSWIFYGIRVKKLGKIL